MPPDPSQWMQRDKRRLHFRLFTLKGILKRFLTCSAYFNDKEMAKLKKVDSEDEKNGTAMQASSGEARPVLRV